MSETQVNLKSIPGPLAPRYTDGIEVKCRDVTVTEQGTKENLPIVDFVCYAPDGTKVVMVLTGRMVCAIAAFVRGINERNHGQPEP